MGRQRSGGRWNLADRGMCADGMEVGGALPPRPAGPHQPRSSSEGLVLPGPVWADRWSLLEKGHGTVLSVRGALLEPPKTNTDSFC